MQDNEYKAKSLSREFNLSDAAETCIITFGCWLDAKMNLSHMPGDIDVRNAIYDMFIDSYSKLSSSESDAFMRASEALKAVR